MAEMEYKKLKATSIDDAKYHAGVRFSWIAFRKLDTDAFTRAAPSDSDRKREHDQQEGRSTPEDTGGP